MNRLLILILLFPIYLDAISYHKRKQKQTEKKELSVVQQRKKRKNIAIFQLRIDGVECATCAHSVLEILSNIEGIEEPTLKNVEEYDFSESFIEFAWQKKNENIPITRIKKLIEKEGFELCSCQGSFNGIFEVEDEKSPKLFFNDLNISPILEALPEKIVKKRVVTVNGKLSYDSAKKIYKFSLL